MRESLANHLTAHGVPFEIGIRSTDVADLLEHMEWAMACGLIGPRYAGMLWAKYLKDRQEERKVRAWWLMDCIEYGAAKGWRRPKARMVEGFAYATCDEHMGHGTRCAVCNGTRQREVGQKIIECPACSGVGFVEYLPERFVAEIGCTMLEWDRVWRERVGWARRYLHRWEVDATEALRRKVGA